jgi:hypothetical protein
MCKTLHWAIGFGASLGTAGSLHNGTMGTSELKFAVEFGMISVIFNCLASWFEAHRIDLETPIERIRHRF